MVRWSVNKTQQIVIVMLITTLVSPIAILSGGGGYHGDEWGIHYGVFAMTWFYSFTITSPNSDWSSTWDNGLLVLDFSMLQNSFILWIFNVLFAIQVVRYCQDKTSFRSAVSMGLLSLVLPSVVAIFTYAMYVRFTGFVMYAGPTPIQLAVGLYILYSTRKQRDNELWVD